jgi:hypothetical protein
MLMLMVMGSCSVLTVLYGPRQVRSTYCSTWGGRPEHWEGCRRGSGVLGTNASHATTVSYVTRKWR